MRRLFGAETPEFFLLLGTTLFLLVFGLVMVLSSSAIESRIDDGNFFARASRQGLFAVIGLPAMLLAAPDASPPVACSVAPTFARWLFGFSVTIADPQSYQDGYTITPLSSGDIYVEAANQYGPVVRLAGFVDLYELPSFRMAQLALPRPQVPALAPVRVPTVLSALPARPMVTVDSHPLPRLEAPDLQPLLHTLHTELTGDPLGLLTATGTAARETFWSAHRAANERVGAVIGEVLHGAVESLGTAFGESMADLQARLVDARRVASADDAYAPVPSEKLGEVA